MKNKRIFTSAFMGALLFFLPQYVFSQITITANDLFSVIGSTLTVEADSSSGLIIDLGLPGPNQIWDFRSVVLNNPIPVNFEYLLPQDTPFEHDFPGANQCEKVLIPFLPDFFLYNFYQINSSSYLDFGDVLIFPAPFQDTFFTFRNELVAPLPINYTDTWTVTSADTVGSLPESGALTLDTTLVTVDGWGTVRIPAGDFDCLRVRTENKITTHIIVSGTILMTTIESGIAYDWISSGSVVPFAVLSQEGETNPDFNNPASITWSTGLSTAVEEIPRLEYIPFDLQQNIPNPFRSETEIQFSLENSGHVIIRVYNLLGEEISVLIDAEYQAGSFKTTWDGKNGQGIDSPTGFYFYTLESQGVVAGRKMLHLN